ncbi:hypothetical protein BHE74_00004689 [Ensete ventricosum]|nr:hypothetical protein GW17_00008887 [Ensete ventricosum]RWW86534.1 hypothetical protein BHE74_00004689 [Ensete ventricosum]RZR85602.1 hypothetical protein BHM03_00012620 [Ensete ventricosum]
MNHTAHSDDLPVIQDSYSLAISDYLGADMSCSPSVQADLNNLQVGMDLHGAETDLHGSMLCIAVLGVPGRLVLRVSVSYNPGQLGYGSLLCVSSMCHVDPYATIDLLPRG